MRIVRADPAVFRIALRGIACLATFGLLSAAPLPAPVQVWRLDCGRIEVRDLDQFSDTRAYVGRRAELVSSCYLIRHGENWMLWEAGLPEQSVNDPADVEQAHQTTTIVAQLARVGLEPDRIGVLGLSHYHYDHTGQAARFRLATLLIGREDADAIRTEPELSKPLAPWFRGRAQIDPVSGDRDVFGDGSVTMLSLPGHTPGHHGLLIAGEKPLLLSGDVAHFRENFTNDGIPSFNTDRADSLASLHRFKALAANLHATVVLQHEPADADKVPSLASVPEGTFRRP
jgi:N-acyl homoserine lactone hydrolase